MQRGRGLRVGVVILLVLGSGCRLDLGLGIAGAHGGGDSRDGDGSAGRDGWWSIMRHRQAGREALSALLGGRKALDGGWSTVERDGGEAGEMCDGTWVDSVGPVGADGGR